ncbi:hypothetical protein J3459_014167 [Metarhizium acridum]|nr:hypothetical protein J3459_014167 [Metarhizium acridum]
MGEGEKQGQRFNNKHSSMKPFQSSAGTFCCDATQPATFFSLCDAGKERRSQHCRVRGTTGSSNSNGLSQGTHAVFRICNPVLALYGQTGRPCLLYWGVAGGGVGCSQPCGQEKAILHVHAHQRLRIIPHANENRDPFFLAPKVKPSVSSAPRVRRPSTGKLPLAGITM